MTDEYKKQNLKNKKVEEFQRFYNENYAHMSRIGDADHTEYNYAFYQLIMERRLQDKYEE